MESNCPFCALKSSDYVHEGKSVFAIYDRFPVSPKHLLIIPKAHRKDFFELTSEESAESFDIIRQLRTRLMAEDQTINGFNLGMNCGRSAGQTVFHCHIHLIPRRDGDTHDPRGGVRGVIAEKQKY